jgi:methylated-DNA-[protein]-cysteine S-methyltransferase
VTTSSQSYCVFPTPLGYCAVAWVDAGIARFQLPLPDAEACTRHLLRRSADARPASPPADVMRVVEDVQHYFGGQQIDFSQVRVELGEQAKFAVEIYSALREIRWGQTTTYGALAKRIGRGHEDARAVGAAMAKNPLPLIVPCHRVLAAGSKIGGFSAPGGATTKRRMLELEGIRVDPPESPQQTLGF